MMIKEHFPDLINDYEEKMRETQKINNNFNTETDKEYSEDENERYQVDGEKDFGSNIFIANDDQSSHSQIKIFQPHQYTDEDLNS